MVLMNIFLFLATIKPLESMTTTANSGNTGIALVQAKTNSTEAQKKVAENVIKSALNKESKGDNKGALADFNKAVIMVPDQGAAYWYRGIFIGKKLHDYKGALADFNQSLKLNPNLIKAYYDRGELRAFALDDFQGAMSDFNKAIQADPSYVYPYAGRARLKYYKLKDSAGGIADMKYALGALKKKGDAENYQILSEELKKWK